MSEYDHSGLKVGDKATYKLVDSTWSRVLGCKTSVIARFTSTQMVLEDGSRFYLEDGRRVGDRSSRLIDPNGPDALSYWATREHQRFDAAVRELNRMAGSGTLTPERWMTYLDSIGRVVAEAQARTYAKGLAAPNEQGGAA